MMAGDPIPCAGMSAEPSAVPRLTLAEIRAARALLGDRILMTPALPLAGPTVEAALAPGTRVLLKIGVG